MALVLDFLFMLFYLFVYLSSLVYSYFFCSMSLTEMLIEPFNLQNTQINSDRKVFV